MAAVLAFVNLLFWLFWIVATPPLPQDYYSERDDRLKRVDGGLEFHLVTDVDPVVILADRPFAFPMVPMRPGAREGMLANLPAFLSAAFAITMLDGIMLPPARSTRIAAWSGTAVFLVVSTVQWALLGWCLARLVGWVAHRRRGTR